MVFFADAFGLDEPYNDPGTVSERNWTLRLPPTWRRDFAQRLETGRALSLPRALALACGARGVARAQPALVERLEAEALALPRVAAAG
jgi:hypothetical protein